jgi:hypothetical protein
MAWLSGLIQSILKKTNKNIKISFLLIVFINIIIKYILKHNKEF